MPRRFTLRSRPEMISSILRSTSGRTGTKISQIQYETYFIQSIESVLDYDDSNQSNRIYQRREDI